MNRKIVLYFFLALLSMSPVLAHHGDLEGLGFLFVFEAPFLMAFFILGLVFSIKRLVKINWGAKHNRRLFILGIFLAILPIGLLYLMFLEVGPDILESISQMYFLLLVDILLLCQVILFSPLVTNARKELVRKLNIGFIGLFIVTTIAFLITLVQFMAFISY